MKGTMQIAPDALRRLPKIGGREIAVVRPLPLDGILKRRDVPLAGDLATMFPTKKFPDICGSSRIPSEQFSALAKHKLSAAGIGFDVWAEDPEDADNPGTAVYAKAAKANVMIFLGLRAVVKTIETENHSRERTAIFWTLKSSEVLFNFFNDTAAIASSGETTQEAAFRRTMAVLCGGNSVYEASFSDLHELLGLIPKGAWLGPDETGQFVKQALALAGKQPNLNECIQEAAILYPRNYYSSDRPFAIFSFLAGAGISADLIMARMFHISQLGQTPLSDGVRE